MAKLPPGYDLRFTEQGDLKALREWLSAPGMLHWFPMSPGRELEEGSQGWIGFSKIKASLTATIDDEPCAIGTLFLMPYRKVAHECLVKMIVAPKWQRHGIGESLLKNLLHLAKTRFYQEIAYFEIVEHNPLEHLLKKMGFDLAAKQNDFFKDEGKYYARLIYDIDLKKVD